jgi:hypothetical protein
MARESKSRRLVAFNVVATITSIEIRRSGELPGMTITVTVHAPLKFDFEKGSLALRDVALSAFQPGVPAL